MPANKDRKPDYISPQGRKFYLQKISTNYAKDLGLQRVQVFDVDNMRIIVQDGKVVYENSSVEMIGAHLDIMSLNKKEAVMAQGRCMKCKKQVEIKNGVEVTMKNGRPAMKGECPICGTKVFCILKKK